MSTKRFHVANGDPGGHLRGKSPQKPPFSSSFPDATAVMSHHRGVLGAPPQRNQHLIPSRSKSKRLRTKRERNAAKFGPKIPLGGSRRGPRAPPPWLQPPPWGGLALGSPLGPPKPVVITQNRLCHRGLFNREVKSLDVRRLLTPCPGGDCPPPAPQIEEGVVGGVPAEALKELVASLASLLGSFGVFLGGELVSERHRSLVAVLRRHRQGLPDLGVFLAHRTPAQPPGTAPTPQGGGVGEAPETPPPPSGVVSSAGQETPRAPWQEARPGLPGRAVSLGGWEVGDPPAGTPSPLRAVDTVSARKSAPKIIQKCPKVVPKVPQNWPIHPKLPPLFHSPHRPPTPPAPFLEPPESRR